MDHRRNRRREQSRRLRDLIQNSGNAQTLPEGTKIITIPVVEMTTNDNGQQVCVVLRQFGLHVAQATG